MAQWTGTWLGGLAAAGIERTGFRGERLGLPAAGPGSVAPWANRLAAFLLDVLAAALIGGLINAFVAHPDPVVRSIAVDGAFVAEVVLLVGLTGQSIGMRLLGLRVVRLRGGVLPGIPAALVRTLLLVVIVPALLSDRDGRGLHDKATGTVVLRA